MQTDMQTDGRTDGYDSGRMGGQIQHGDNWRICRRKAAIAGGWADVATATG
ncbi:hypothetical protein [Paenibacillus sp. MMS18-CY102]|uniref:hypothetical protein n=1 Tax=Paenibacillus sp. MMS18-CY102 TaxID=2682849 RepID=UPI001365764C|nr:hypothetical protein [Paenibacillus sp. MMS18-CY102]MWC27386.1 hypothetical protein [Paenibacillus sp. MMS18-CY102]